MIAYLNYIDDIYDLQYKTGDDFLKIHFDLKYFDDLDLLLQKCRVVDNHKVSNQFISKIIMQKDANNFCILKAEKSQLVLFTNSIESSKIALLRKIISKFLKEESNVKD